MSVLYKLNINQWWMIEPMKLLKEFLIAFTGATLEKNIHGLDDGSKDFDNLDLKESKNSNFENLRNNIFTKDKKGSLRNILFVAPSSGNGVSALVSKFSTNLSRSSNCRVLIINANLRESYFQSSMNAECYRGKLNFQNGSKVVRYEIQQTATKKLWILNFEKNDIPPASFFRADCFKKLLKRVGKIFNFIILDGPAVNKYPDSLLLCQVVDGVVLVVEAGKTRREIAQIAKKRLEGAGAKLLGVVLNKRTYFIPEFIYNRI